MNRLRRTCRDLRKQTRKRELRLEVLCDRVLLHGSGLGVSDPLPWFDPGALTYSFAPDETSVAGENSELFAKLDQLGETSVWQNQFDEAFNAWLAPLNATIQKVDDAGVRFGASGRTQGDQRFGDIRIAAIPLSQNVLATTIPHSAMVQGTWAGDILINADAEWDDLQDVFAVAFHEFGHVLGLPHSDDLASPMYFHGVHDAVVPTAADIEQLLDIYVGINFEDEDRDANSNASPDNPDPQSGESESESRVNLDNLDLSTAALLSPAVGSTIRYSSSAVTDASSQSFAYRLEPTASEAEGLENLTISLQSVGSRRLMTDIVVLDSQGRVVEAMELHHGQGSVVVQAFGVENNQVHYVVVTPSGLVGSQTGEFEIVMDYGPELRLSREIGEITLDHEQYVKDQSFSVASPRLVHINVNSSSDGDAPTTVRALLLDSNGNSLARIAIPAGASRSAPLTFLPVGQYNLRLIADTQSSARINETTVTVFLDEVSIDVGPGVADPTGTPFLPCSDPAADPSFCSDEFVPIVPDAPTSPDPLPDPDDEVYPWWWDYGYGCDDYTQADFPYLDEYDPEWWAFYVEVCQRVTTPPTTTPPITTPPTTTPPTTTPPTTNPPTTTPPTTNPPTTTPPTTNPPTTNPPTTTPPTTTPPTTNPPTTNPPTTNPPTTNPPTTNPPTTTPPTTATVSPWHNISEARDVSGNSIVSAQDALIIINMLQRATVDQIAVTEVVQSIFADVNGDYRVTASDALMVINSLSLAHTTIEGEAVFGTMSLLRQNREELETGIGRYRQVQRLF